MVTGVSGSGKSSLIKKVLYPALAKRIGGHSSIQSGQFQSMDGHLNRVDSVEFIDQNPIGRSSRSNPVTFTKAFDDIRIPLRCTRPLARQTRHEAGTLLIQTWTVVRCEMFVKAKARPRLRCSSCRTFILTCECM